MKKVLGLSLLLLTAASPVRSSGAAAAEREPVAIRLQWDYKGIEPEMSVYEAADDPRLEIWNMGVRKSLAELPVKKRIEDSVVRARPGEDKIFVLVYRNVRDKPVRFFAAPHRLSPEEASLGFDFACLCMNHIYTVPKGYYWYRVVKLSLDDDFKGRSLDVRHTLVSRP